MKFAFVGRFFWDRIISTIFSFELSKMIEERCGLKDLCVNSANELSAPIVMKIGRWKKTSTMDIYLRLAGGNTKCRQSIFKEGASMNEQSVISKIENMIYVIRGQKVMLDSDLAELYGVETKNLNKAVKRNLNRFPEDFMFQVSEEEFSNLRFQFGTSSLKYGGRRYLPFVFTENGVACCLKLQESLLIKI